jgi:threonine dehydratase
VTSSRKPADRLPDLQDLLAARKRISRWAHLTPVATCEGIDRMSGARLFFKCENLQKVGAFKFRGASNVVLSLGDDEASRGVATHSSGNHAGALALAARLRGISAHVVMPSNSSAPKMAAVRGYGAQIIECEPTLDSREETLDRVVEQTGAIFVHPYDDYGIIAGQATAAMELLEQVADLDAIITPVGGGGLLSGTALAVNHILPETRVIAGEPRGADDAYRSLREGRIVPSVDPQTIADGLLTSLGERNFSIIQENVERIITVGESEIVHAMRIVWERMKMIIEPSSAVALAVVLENPELFSGLRVGIIISGGNVDLDRLPW